MFIKTCVFICLLFGAVSPTKVSTPTATYTGSRLTLEQFDSVRPSSSVDQFLGIRYGQPPTGEHRFKRSKPAWIESAAVKTEKVKNEIDAKNWSPNCMQQPGFLELNLQTKERSEDCLYLNIWTPVSKKAELKPVFLWFSSGSFISDSSSRKLYLGAHLAATADAVVVTVNFRIDAFGFMFSGKSKLNGSESAEGNLALWDQLLALEWIQEHIEYFGGDPAKVTIGGHGSGATSVGLHLLSSQSRQYFTRALMMSGSIFAQLVNANKAAGKQVAENWAEAAKKINCGNGRHWTIETLKCLQSASTDDLLKLLDPLASVSLSPEVVLGDDFLPFDSLLGGINQLASSQKEIQVLLGSTNDEGSLILPMMDMKTFALFDPKPLSQSEAFNELKKLAALLVPPKGAQSTTVNGDEVARFYVYQQSSPGNSFHRTIGTALGDFYVSCPIVEFGNQLRATSSRLTIFQYVWSRKVPSRDVPCADWMGACTASDVSMLFGQPFEERDQFSPDDRKFSVRFMQTVGKFLWEGKPMKQEGKEWPFTSNESSPEAALYYEFAGTTSSKRIYRKNWKREICADLWKKYLVEKA